MWPLGRALISSFRERLRVAGNRDSVGGTLGPPERKLQSVRRRKGIPAPFQETGPPRGILRVGRFGGRCSSSRSVPPKSSPQGPGETGFAGGPSARRAIVPRPWRRSVGRLPGTSPSRVREAGTNLRFAWPASRESRGRRSSIASFERTGLQARLPRPRPPGASHGRRRISPRIAGRQGRGPVPEVHCYRCERL